VLVRVWFRGSFCFADREGRFTKSHEIHTKNAVVVVNTFIRFLEVTSVNVNIGSKAGSAVPKAKRDSDSVPTLFTISGDFIE